jgi:hypothetical protein
MFKPNHVYVLLLLLAAACAAQTGTEQVVARDKSIGNAALELNQPEHGFQLEGPAALVDPGDDVRMCEVVVLPGTPADTYYVPRIEAVLGAQGEELVVHAARPGSETAAIMEPGTSVPCTRAGEAFGEELSEVLATQDRYTDERFPEGTGKILHGGQKLAFEVHYVNVSNEQVPARAKISLHTASAERVQRLAHSANFANLTIYTPPRGRSSHVGECVVRQEMVVNELVRRTQRYGTAFKVWFAGGPRDGELAWDSQDRRDNRYEPNEPIHLMPGEGFRFECTYVNGSSRELRYGVSASDETCMLQAKYSVPALEVDAGEAALEQEDGELREGCLLFDIDPDGVARR